MHGRLCVFNVSVDSLHRCSEAGPVEKYKQMVTEMITTMISIVCVPFVYHPLTACVFVLYSLGLFMLLCEVVCCICLFFTDCFPSSLQDDGDVEDDMTIREVRRAATQNLLLLWFKCCFLCTFYVFIWLFIKGKLQIWQLKGDLPKESWKALRSFEFFWRGLKIATCIGIKGQDWHFSIFYLLP